MNVLTKLWSALGALSDSVLALSDTLRQADRGLRQRLQLDGPAEGEPPAALPPPADDQANGHRRKGRTQAQPS